MGLIFLFFTKDFHHLSVNNDDDENYFILKKIEKIFIRKQELRNIFLFQFGIPQLNWFDDEKWGPGKKAQLTTKLYNKLNYKNFHRFFFPLPPTNFISLFFSLKQIQKYLYNNRPLTKKKCLNFGHIIIIIIIFHCWCHYHQWLKMMMMMMIAL